MRHGFRDDGWQSVGAKLAASVRPFHASQWDAVVSTKQLSYFVHLVEGVARFMI